MIEQGVRTDEDRHGLGIRTLVGLGVLGAAARVFNLGSFSLWLDEILLVRRASGSLAEVWRACQANAEHPPLSALVSALALDLAPSETWLRLVHAAAALVAVLLLSDWAARIFGRRAGLAAGLVFALSPFAVRYAQEIRPYAFLLLAAAATLWWLERGRGRRTGRGWAIGLWLLMMLGFFSHYLYPLVWVPLAWTLVETALFGTATERKAAQRLAVRAGVGMVVTLSLFLSQWLGVLGTATSRPAAGGTADWTATFLLRRLHFLTVGGKEGEAVTAGGVLCVALIAAGCVVALRRRPGRALLAGAIAGIAGVEAGLLAGDHWSNARYDMVGWIFLVVLLGLGADLAGRRRTFFVATLVTIAAACLAGLLRYDRSGRPDWDRVAAAVSALRRPGDVLLAENDWTRISLEHYLGTSPRRGASAQEPAGDSAPVAATPSPAAAIAGWGPGRCALLVTSGYPSSPRLRALARARPLLAVFPAAEARIALLGPEDREALGPVVTGDSTLRLRPSGSTVAASQPCEEADRRLPFELRQARKGRVDRTLEPVAERLRRWLAGGVWTLDFDPASARHLDHGWSTFEQGSGGRTFVWATGLESVLRFELGPPVDREVEIHFRPYQADAVAQEMTLAVNGTALPPRRLDGGWQQLTIPVPAGLWREGRNVLAFRFLRTVTPRDVDATSTDTRPLTAAFDRLRVRPAE